MKVGMNITSAEESVVVDGIEFQEFNKDWKNRLYVLCNRMSSGSCYPKHVRGVEIPKKNGKKRFLSVPTIEERVV